MIEIGRRRGHRSRGQALVELALVAPVILLLLMGSIQVAFIVYGNVMVDTAAREGARVASLNPNGSNAYVAGVGTGVATTCSGGTASSNPVCLAVWNEAGSIGASKLDVSISSQSNPTDPSPTLTSDCAAKYPTAVADGYVVVTVRYNAPIFVPFVERGAHTVSASVTARVAPCSMTRGS